MASVAKKDSYYDRFKNWYHQPSLPAQAKQTMNSLESTSNLVQKIIQDPENFFEKALKGAVKGLTSSGLENEDGITLTNKIKDLAVQGVSAASVVTLEQLLNYSETFELDEEDKDLKKTALKTLKEAKKRGASLHETAKAVWEKVNKYHILCGSLSLNMRSSGNEFIAQIRQELEGSEKNDGVSPLQLSSCQKSYRLLRKEYYAGAIKKEEKKRETRSATVTKRKTQDEIHSLKSAEEKTNEKIDRFCNKVIHYCTMYALDNLFQNKIDPSEYNKILQEDTLDFKEKYLSRFGRTRQFFYGKLYDFTFFIIHPLIANTTKEALQGLRVFLNNDKDLLEFIQDKIKEMAIYYGEIENLRKQYIKNPQNGSFENYLEAHITTYGKQNLSEQELCRIFEEYIVSNFVPRPEFKINHFRIPILFTFFEWIVHSIRKKLVRHFLKKTEIVDHILTQGTNSVHYAQLGLKRLLQQKLQLIASHFDHSRHADSEENEHDSQSQIEKGELITRNLHLIIQQHSEKILRFIEIEACNAHDQKLANLDKSISEFIAKVSSLTKDLFNWNFFSPRQAIEDAATDILETSFLSLFHDRGTQIEEELQETFQILDRTFSYMSPQEAIDFEREYRSECADIDASLTTLIEQISLLSVETVLENYFRKVPGEKHLRMQSFINNERETLWRMSEEIVSLVETLQHFATTEGSPLDTSEKIKSQFLVIIYSIEECLGHMSTTLNSERLQECYSDVKGDVHNLYAIYICTFSNWAELSKRVLLIVEKMHFHETCIKDCKTGYEFLNKFQNPEIATLDELESKIQNILRFFDLSNSDRLENIHVLLKKRMEIEKKRHLFSRIEEIRSSITKNESGVVELENFKRKLKGLSELTHRFQHMRRLFPSEKRDLSRSQLKTDIQTQYSDLMQTDNEKLKEFVIPILRAHNTLELYKIFYPGFNFGRQAWIFTSIDRLILQSQKQNIFYQEEIKSCQKEIGETVVEALEKEKASLNQEISNCLTDLEKIFEKKIQEEKEAIIESQKEICEIAKEMLEMSKTHQYATQLISVKGCLSIGEIKLYRKLAPQISAAVAPALKEGIRTMVDSLGKPFHYKQLALRLFFLDFATRYQKT